MTTLAAFMSSHPGFAQSAPWPRAIVDESGWNVVIGELASGRWNLLDLWGEPGAVYMALLEADVHGAAPSIGIASLACPDQQYPSVSLFHPPALRLERAMRDIVGIEPIGLPDPRPWLDHGAWGQRHPEALRHGAASISPERPQATEPTPYPFLPAEGEGLHRIAVGPVHAGIIEPGHFRFTVNGETIVRMEEQLGYVHKSIAKLMSGSTLLQGARLAGRTSGDSTVANQFAFARAVESALGIEVPPRAAYLRALMAELERLANHLGDVGAICNDASFALMHAHCSVLREQVLRAADATFNHRLMRDRIVPGGVVDEITPDGTGTISALADHISKRFPALIELYDNTASLQDRTVATGVLTTALARQYAAGGYIGRASGRGFDARHAFPYPPYDSLDFDVPLRHEGDVNARIWIRIREIEQSLALIDRLLERLPDGPIRIDLPQIGERREGMALVEGFRGDVLVWLRIGTDGHIERGRLRDPSWFQWPLLEAAIEGNIVADFPLCNKSFNCSYSGHDL
jgi:Ni,Fe-hydrogenase III large subunit